MTLLDVLLVAATVLSVVAGYRMGLLVRAAGLGGVVVGIALSVLTVPFGTRLLAPTTPLAGVAVTAFVTVMTVLLAMVVLQGIAFRLRQGIVDSKLRHVDHVGGAVAGLVGVLVFVWFTAPLAAMIPGVVAQQVRGSAVVGWVSDLTPRTPNPLAALQTLLADTRFPEVFSDLAPAPATGPPPAAIVIPATAVDDAATSAVKVEVSGCGALFSGSGWTVGEDLVVTNAHVVAGADGVLVRRPDGSRLDGEVVVLDDDRDLALVRVDGLGLPSLQLGEVERDEDAVTLGHPLGQEELRVAPARVERTIRAVGRDIYGADRTRREVLVLAARLQQGDSGSAVVDADGTVVGTVFAISPDDPGTAYALSNRELRAVLAAPREPGASGRCA